MEGQIELDRGNDYGFRVEGIGYWTLSLDSETMRWSPELSRLNQLPHLDEPPMGYGATRIADDYWDIMRKNFYDCVEVGVSYDLEIELEFDDDSRRWVRVLGEPMRNDVGDIIGARGAVIDIDRYRRPAESANRKAQVLEHVVLASGDVVLLLSPSAQVLYATEESLREANFGVDDIVRGLTAALTTEDTSLEQQLARVAAAGEKVTVELDQGLAISADLHPTEQGIIVHVPGAR